jgi:hypothetical protein
MGRCVDGFNSSFFNTVGRNRLGERDLLNSIVPKFTNLEGYRLLTRKEEGIRRPFSIPSFYVH